MFIFWYIMALGITIFGIAGAIDTEPWVYAIGFGLLGEIDMLVCNIIIRLRKKSEFEEWAMKFKR